MNDQSKVFTNTIQNAIIDALKKGAERGYLGPVLPTKTNSSCVLEKPIGQPAD
jgi:hypothetical protein